MLEVTHLFRRTLQLNVTMNSNVYIVIWSSATGGVYAAAIPYQTVCLDICRSGQSGYSGPDDAEQQQSQQYPEGKLPA